MLRHEVFTRATEWPILLAHTPTGMGVLPTICLIEKVKNWPKMQRKSHYNPMGTRMLYRCWINIELRRRRCVEKC